MRVNSFRSDCWGRNRSRVNGFGAMLDQQADSVNERCAGTLDRSAAYERNNVWWTPYWRFCAQCALPAASSLKRNSPPRAPWCVTSQVTPEDCIPFMPQPAHLIAYHYVTAGTLVLRAVGQPPITVEAGEIILMPRNDEHVIGSAGNLKPVSANYLIQPAPAGGLMRIVHGGGGERTQILCGYIATNVRNAPIIGILPRVLKIGAEQGAAGNWIESSFRFAAHQLAEGQIGSPAVLSKLAELLFMEAVRRYLATQPPAAHAWVTGLHDPIIERALGLLHSQIARRWTTEALAKETAVSRSAFAERFTHVMGEPPMRYLSRQRFEEASERLRDSTAPIARIAFEVGYESEAAFSRAFKREYGVPPASWRRDHMADKA